MSDLPPPLYGIIDGQDHWFASLNGTGPTLQITKPIKNEMTKRYRDNAGMLELTPPVNGVGRVPFGSWNLVARKIDKLGWVLAVAITNRDKKQHNVDIGFQSRHHGPSVRRWVTTINSRLKATLGKSAPR